MPTVSTFVKENVLTDRILYLVKY